MIKEDFQEKRSLLEKTISSDLLVVGGGLSGVCCALTAARAGIKVTLVQDRPVLGGNSSSEVRLWILGATSHMGNNNRWSREGGVIDELLVENMYRNKEGNPLILDTILLEKVKQEPNITLLLNTAVHDLDKSSATVISTVRAFCSQNSTAYILKAKLFCDASGDGILGFLSGAAFRMGAEDTGEFGEKFAPSKAYGELLGHSIYFYTKDTGKPVKFIAPEFALDDITKIPRFRSFNTKEYGCRLWWLEYGGRLDTVHDTEEIKWELWKVVYGAWNYIKNSGEFPEADTLTLEWVGTIPGKRESRRFEGDYVMIQQDIIYQRMHSDAVAYGGWSIDLHPGDGVFSEKPGCNQWHSKGIYQIPFRSLYSKNINNLFLAGRIMSASHVAFASTRVMATGAHVGQAIGMAAKIAIENALHPREIIEKNYMSILQQQLLRTGHHIPGYEFADGKNLVQTADISVSSTFELEHLPEDLLKDMQWSMAQLVPLDKGKVPLISLKVVADLPTTLQIQLRISSKAENFTPDLILEKKNIILAKGENLLKVAFETELMEACYAFIVIQKNTNVKVYCSNQRVTGILSVFNGVNKAVSNFGKQVPTSDIGVDTFEFWCPQRRPEGHNIAMGFDPPIRKFTAANLKNGVYRPIRQPNAWVASLEDKNPSVSLSWDIEQEIHTLCLFFDTDLDHPMESVLMGHPEHVMPFCVRNITIKDRTGRIIFSQENNYQTMLTVRFEKTVFTKQLSLFLEHPGNGTPAALFGIICY